MLHRVTDIGHARAGPHRLDRLPERLFGDPQQLGGLRRNFSDADRNRRIAEEPVELGAQVDRNNVAVAQPARGRRNAVHDLLVDRCANRCRVPLVALERRHCACRPNLALGQRIEIGRRHAWRGHLPQLMQHAPHELVGVTQPAKLGRRPADNHRASLAPARTAAGIIWSMAFDNSAATFSGACAPLIERNVGRDR